MTNKVLTADEVAKQLRISRQQVIMLARAGELGRLPIGHNTIRFTQKAVDKYIQSKEECNGG